MHARNRTDSRFPRRRPAVLGLVGVTATLALAACGSTSSGGSNNNDATAASATPVADKIVKGGTLTVSGVDPGTAVDPLTTASPAGTGIVAAVAEQLTRIAADGSAQPVLADKWSVSGDGKTWTFHVRQGVTFQDGTPLTPKDVVASYDRIIAPKSPSPGKSSFAGLLKDVIAAADGESVDFHLARPFSDFPALTAGSNTYILPADYKAGSWEKHPVGTGPFVVKQYSRGQSVHYEANPSYWDKAHLYLGALDFKLYKDAQARVLALQSGEIDSLIGEPVEASLTAALDPSKFEVATVPNAGFTAFALRADQAPFDDVKVRQAIAWALDREGIVKTVLGGAGTLGNDTVYGPVYQIKPRGLAQRQQDPAKVKELLGGKTVSFTITASPADETLATVIQQQLNQVGGFKVKIKILPSSEYYADGNDAPWLSAPATLTYWASRPSPSQYNNFLYFKSSDWNASKYSNPELEKLSAQYDATTDQAKRQELVDQIAKIEYDEVPVIVPAFGKSKTFSSKKVHGLHLLPSSTLYTGVWVG
ncbi:MAG: hypothetical protein JWO74_2575 [Solirubrobacterales bacterium]|nr:hypothetical protein [Solirubrobacterales bacterium]